ncbi:MAG: MarR family transcriptional regulator [Pseudomonadota bacterium]
MKELPTASSRNKREQLETSSWFAVVRAYLECSKRYTEMLQHFELTVAQYDALNAIESLGSNAVPKAIADRLVVTRANITGLLRRLEQRKLVQITAHQADGRSVVCALTRKGKSLHDRAHNAASRFVRAQLQPFEDSDLKYTEQMMRSMHAHLQTLDPNALAASDNHRET